MTEQQNTQSVSFTAEAMIAPPARPRWQRVLRWVLRRPKDVAIQPPGTVPLIFECRDGDALLRYYYPAARISPFDPPADA